VTLSQQLLTENANNLYLLGHLLAKDKSCGSLQLETLSAGCWIFIQLERLNSYDNFKICESARQKVTYSSLSC
jgi:hypothetical protein